MAIRNDTFSQASEAGVWHYNWQDGPPAAGCGREAVPASRSVSRGRVKAPMMSGTCGPCSSGSSRSAALTLFLVNRLKARLGTDGSMEYAQTWKEKATPAGTPRWAHTASTRRISDSGCIGWPSPNAHDGRRPGCDLKSTQGGNLSTDAHLAGWPTPTKGNAEGSQMGKDASSTGRRPDGSKATVSLNQVAQTAGWCSPSARDWKDTPGMNVQGVNPDGSMRSREDQLPRQVAGIMDGWPTPRATENDQCTADAIAAAGSSWMGQNRGATVATAVQLISGPTPDGSTAGTESGGAFQLNPAFSLWLMGFRIEWHDVGVSALRCYAEQATPSCRKSPPPSSPPA